MIKKFRAYNTLKNEFVYMTLVDGLPFAQPEANKSEKGYVLMPWQQFTGLVDKNGKEIYEEDILNLSQWEPSNYMVSWDRGAFYMSKRDGTEMGDIKYVEQGEIIGNFYENPNLIN